MPPREAPVDFVVIGAMKAMTTSLLATLADHPDIAVSAEKETQYFVAETGWRLGPAWYDGQFAHARPDQLRGEASPQYTFFPFYAGVPERMVGQAPRARLVYLVRDPVARAVSQWRHAVTRGHEQRPLAQTLLTDTRYQDPSRYWMQLQQHLRVFDEEQVLVVDADRLVHDAPAALREIAAHIGADPGLVPTELVHLNAAEGRQVRPSVARARRRQLGRRVDRVARRVHVAGWERLTTVDAPRAVLDDDVAALLREVLSADSSALGNYLGVAAPTWAR